MQEHPIAWRKWAIVFLGAYLFASSWSFGVSEIVSSSNAWVVGVCLIVATLRVRVVSGPLAAELIRAGLGSWLLASPFVLGFAGSGATAWNAWIVGALVGRDLGALHQSGIRRNLEPG